MPNLIEIEKYKSGMILAAPILNRYGQVLLSTGIVLNQSHKKMFKIWGIKLITVKDKEFEDEVVVTEELQNEAEKIFSLRLNWEPKSDFEKDLIKTGIKKILLTQILK